MPFSNYTSGSRFLAEELLESLTDDDFETAEKFLSGITWQEWYSLRKRLQQDTAAYVAASPSQRLKKKTWNKDVESKLVLVLSAYQHCMEAAEFLEAVERIPIGPKSTRRQVAHDAGLAFQKIAEIYTNLWPNKIYLQFLDD